MRTLKPVLGVIGAVVPVLYCGGLLYYFLDVTGSVREAKLNGLGPTLLGLGIVGLIFCIPLTIKIVRIFTRPRSPGSGGDGSTRDGDREFDADAVVARYMAQRSAEASLGSPAGPTAHLGGAAKRSSFGRKV